MKRLMMCAAALVAALCFTPARAQTATSQAANYQGGSTHTGFADVPGLAPPLRQKWSVNFGQPASYPVIADGRVFVTVKNSSGYGTKLYALDAATGATLWGPFDLGAVYWWSALCYEGGRVFALNGDGMLRAFDAASGAVVWSRQMPGQYSFDSAPTVRGGVVYVGGSGSGGTLYAVEAATGTVLWTVPVANGDQSSPAVGDEAVYVSYACLRAYALAPASGALLWRNITSCSGGGGKTTVLYGGRLYARDATLGNAVFDAGTGASLGTFNSTTAPAFAGDLGFFTNYSSSPYKLEARELGGRSLVWSFSGDGVLTSAPLVVNDHVYVGSFPGKLYALDAQTGAEVWSENVGANIPSVDEHNVSQPLTGFAAAEGLLVVPTKTTLVAYEHDSGPFLKWGTPSPAANAALWNNTPVELPFTASAPEGEVTAEPAGPLRFEAEGTNLTRQVVVTNAAGGARTFTSPAFNIDMTAPVTSAQMTGTSGSEGWYLGPVNVWVTRADNLSGSPLTSYSVNGGTTLLASGVFTVSGEGTHSVSYWSADRAGNVESPRSAAVKIDASAPVTQAAVSGTPSANNWRKGPAEVTLAATDAASGVAQTYYTLDGGPAQTYAGAFAVPSGSHVVRYWSTDVAGRTEQQRTLTVNVDADAPVTQFSAAGTLGGGGWYRTNVQVTLAGADPQSGVAATYYSVDGGPAQTYAGAFTVTGSGRHQVSYWSVDQAGNAEPARASAVNLDFTGPTTQNQTSGPAGNSVYFRGPVQTSLTAADDLSGVASIHYRIDGGAAQTYSAPFTVTGDGTHAVDFWSVDVAGNQNYSYTVMIRIDATAPASQAVVTNSPGDNGWSRGPAQVALAASDNLSGVQAIYYSVDGGLTQAYAGALTLSADGVHTVNFWSVDQANNVEATRSVVVRLDGGAPTVTAVANPATRPKGKNPVSVTVTGRVTDATSGARPGGATYSVADEYGVAQPSGAIVVNADGTYSFTLSLPATRNSRDSDGHKYTITVRALDQAGNAGAASAAFTIL